MGTHIEQIEQRGYTIVEDGFSPDLADELIQTLDRLEHDHGVVPATNAFEGVNTLRIYNLLARDDVIDLVPVHPAVLPVVEGEL